MVLSFQGDAGEEAGVVDVYLDPTGSAAGPTGDPINLVPSADLSSPEGGLVQYEFDVSDIGVEVTSGDIYVVVGETTGFLGIASDVEPQSPEYYDRNWVNTAAGWSTIFDAVGGYYPDLVGDFGILAQFMGLPGRSYAVTSTGAVVPDELVTSGELTNYNVSGIVGDNTLENPEFISQLTEPYVPLTPSPSNSYRDDELLEYRVYEVASGESETLVATTTDTFATVTASPNYLEYCYNVKAFWDTGDPSDGGYGQLESRASNLACTVPYKSGDVDFDNDVDITDILAVVDFILEEDIPTDDQIRNVDVNMDEVINIADVVMMVDIIFGGTARRSDFDSNEIAYLDLGTDYENSQLKLDIEYDGPVRGLQFEISYDPKIVILGAPTLTTIQENVVLSYSLKEPGKLRVIAAAIEGGNIERLDETILNISMNFKGSERDICQVTMDEISLAGATGGLVNYVARTSQTEVNLIPGSFALHQNYPNPFNPRTEIRFDLPKEGNVELAIYNLMGQKIRNLTSGSMAPGYHSIVWNGTNDIGSQVASGMYFYSLSSEAFHSTKKMLYLK